MVALRAALLSGLIVTACCAAVWTSTGTKVSTSQRGVQRVGCRTSQRRRTAAIAAHDTSRRLHFLWFRD